MTCSRCEADVPAGRVKCPRCGAMPAVEAPSLGAEVQSRPWLIALLILSVLVTLWAATRRAPPPVQILPAEEPVVELPASAPEPGR